VGKRMMMSCWLAVAACGGSETPVEKCERFEDTVCERLIACIPQPGVTQDTCVHDLGTVAPCSQVTAVPPTFDTCISELEAARCADLFSVDSGGDPVTTFPMACEQASSGVANAAATLLGVRDAISNAATR